MLFRSYRFLATVIPVYPTEHLAAVTTDNHLSETVVAAESSVFPIRAGVDNSAADKLLLHLHENFTRDDGFMAVFNIVLWNKAVIFNPLFRKEVNGIGFLQQSITDVFLISQNLVYDLPPKNEANC